MKLSGPTKATTDHDEIRDWVEERGGAPSHVWRTLEAVDWDDWFQAFDDDELARRGVAQSRTGVVSSRKKAPTRRRAAR